MLNGIDPIIIFHFYNKGVMDFLEDIPFVSTVAEVVGVPIPIYLSETLTGIYVDSETRGIDVSTKVDAITEKDPLTLEAEPPEVSQTAIDATVSISMFATRDSIVLTGIIALAEMIIARLVTQEYGISYINGSTVIFNGMLHRFQTTINRNDDLVRIDLIISNAKKEAPTPKAGPVPISKVTGALPL